MIRQLKIYRGESFDPHYNLAVEQHLLETVEDGTCILYLWQNENTVVIGRNQNAWKECRTTLLAEEGGRLARRLSGGGAVFHDLGNLNFTFLVPAGDFDIDRQLTVIQEACRSLGIQAEKSGRNDVLADGRKFSGNAFYKNGVQSYHHGTLMVNVDKDRLTRYLNPSKAKLEAKGVDSVRSRVVNLCEFRPDLTISMLRDELEKAFSAVYGLAVEIMQTEDLDAAAIDALYQRNRSWEWNHGSKTPFSFSCEGRYPWGGVQIDLQVDNGIIQDAKVYSDAMDWEISPQIEKALIGCRFALEAMQERLMSAKTDISNDICHLLAQQEI